MKNVVRVFSLLSTASSNRAHGFDEKKIATHVEYCKHFLDAAKVHCEAAEREEQQNRQKLEVARQLTLAEEARRKAEEQRKVEMERLKKEEELKQVKQQEQHFERIKEQWKSSINTSGSKWKERPQGEDEEGGEWRKKKGGKRKRKDKSTKGRYDPEDDFIEDGHVEDAYMMDDQEDDGAGKSPDDVLAAAGLEDSDVEDKGSATNHIKRDWSESGDDERGAERLPDSSPAGQRENSGDNGEDDGANKLSRAYGDKDDDE